LFQLFVDSSNLAIKENKIKNTSLFKCFETVPNHDVHEKLITLNEMKVYLGVKMYLSLNAKKNFYGKIINLT